MQLSATARDVPGREPPYEGPEYEGEVLPLDKVKRSDTGYYLCIASNGLPPSVSKKIKLEVHCEFTLRSLILVAYCCL